MTPRPFVSVVTPVYNGEPLGAFRCPAGEVQILSSLNYNGFYPPPDPQSMPISGHGWSSYVINAKIGGNGTMGVAEHVSPAR